MVVRSRLHYTTPRYQCYPDVETSEHRFNFQSHNNVHIQQETWGIRKLADNPARTKKEREKTDIREACRNTNQDRGSMVKVYNDKARQNKKSFEARTRYAWENRCAVILTDFAGFNKVLVYQTEAPFNNE